MENYDLEKEKQAHPYKYYGSVFEEEHNGAKFLMRSALSYVIDDYDDYLGSVEQSHYEDLNYDELIDFSQPDTDTTLDLTWMNSEDVFKLRNNQQYPSINEIWVNIDNIGYSSLPAGNDRLSLKVSAIGSKSNFIQQIKAFRSFISRNNVNAITLVGFNKTLESILTLYAKKAEIEISTDNDLTSGYKMYR